jgi:hypothetical protein
MDNVADLRGGPGAEPAATGKFRSAVGSPGILAMANLALAIVKLSSLHKVLRKQEGGSHKKKAQAEVSHAI